MCCRVQRRTLRIDGTSVRAPAVEFSLQHEGTRIAFVPSQMKVRLTKKLAEQLDGIDVSDRRQGDVLDLSPHDAKMLVEERWAIPERRERSESIHGHGRRADDYPRLRSESSH